MTVDWRYLEGLLSSTTKHSVLDKLLVIASGMDPARTLSFTLNFGASRHRRLSQKPAETVIRTLRNEVGRLQRLGPVVFSLERTGEGRLHLHGLIETSHDGREVRDALRSVGGRCDDRVFANLRQAPTAATEPGTSPIGWCLYMTKELVNAPAETVDQSVYISPGAKLIYESQFDWLRRSSEAVLALDSPYWGRVGRRPSHGFVMAKPTLH
jgi:hypothetical protein